MGFLGLLKTIIGIVTLKQATAISFLGAFAKLQKAIISFVMSVSLSVRPHRITQLALDEFLRNLIFNFFSKICRENSSFIKIPQE
jgi:hypothetical protein